MILSAAAMAGGLILAFISPYFVLLPLSVLILRIVTYFTRLRKVHGRMMLALFGPLLDIFYSIGFVEGLVASSVGKRL